MWRYDLNIHYIHYFYSMWSINNQYELNQNHGLVTKINTFSIYFCGLTRYNPFCDHRTLLWRLARATLCLLKFRSKYFWCFKLYNGSIYIRSALGLYNELISAHALQNCFCEATGHNNISKVMFMIINKAYWIHKEFWIQNNYNPRLHVHLEGV